MSRIEPATPPFSNRVAEDLEKLMPPGIPPIRLFRVLAKNPRVLRRVRKGGLLDPGSVSLRQRELMILRTTARCGGEYEWGVHVAFFAGAAGLTAEQIEATVLGDAESPCWSEEDALVIALADALHDGSTIPDALWGRLSFEEAQVLELVALAGQYHTISFIVNAAEIEREPGAPGFPSR